MSQKKVNKANKINTLPSYDRKFEFCADSLNPKTSVLAAKGTSLTAPTVHYTPDVWNAIWFMVRTAQQEIGWLGLVDTLANGDYLVTEVFVPEQEVHHTETDITPEAMVDLYNELAERGVDTSKLIYWGHSHVDMGVSPSMQDEEQVDEYLEDCPLFIRGIYNRKYESKVDVFDRDNALIFQSVDDVLYMSQEDKDHLAKLMAKNVKEAKPVTVLGTNPQTKRNGYNGGGKTGYGEYEKGWDEWGYGSPISGKGAWY